MTYRESLDEQEAWEERNIPYEKLDEAKLSRQLMEAKQEIERLRDEHSALVDRLREFAGHVRGYGFWYENGRAKQFIDDVSTAVLSLVDGPLKVKGEVEDE